MSSSDRALARPFMVVLLMGELMIAALSFEYFLAPQITSVVVTLCLAMAVVSTFRPEPKASEIVVR